MLGRTATGVSFDSIEDGESISIEEMFSSDEQTFMLEVGDDSMTGDHICKGDLVVLHRTEKPDEGRIVAALLENGEVVLRRFYHENDRILLQSSNNLYNPIRLGDVKIQGVVKGVIRKI